MNAAGLCGIVCSLSFGGMREQGISRHRATGTCGMLIRHLRGNRVHHAFAAIESVTIRLFRERVPALRRKERVMRVRGFFVPCISLLTAVFVLTGEEMFAQSSATAAIDGNDSNVLLARGVLTCRGKAGSLWTLDPKDSPKVRGESIVQVTFTTPAGEGSRTYTGYDGKVVELVGEVKSIFHGNALLSKVRTIGILDSPLELTAVLLSEGFAPRPSDSSVNPGDRIAYKHAYYLFLASVPTGCQACYVPLLITQLSLGEIANEKTAVHDVFIITYERDSIWEMKGAAPIEPPSIEAATRVIHINGRTYRYQEISPTEVLNLLENPSGTIPISRAMVMNKEVPGASLPQLIEDFRVLQVHTP